jgi:hypothetical protein
MAKAVTAYTEAQADRVCEWVAQGRSLVSYCKKPGTPGYRTIMRWLSEQPAFQANYRTAHAHQADYIADEIIDIADKARMGTRTTKRADGEVETVTVDMVERSRLQIHARQWYAAKLAPKKYGDKLELGGVVGIAKAPTDLTDEELQAIAQGRKPPAAGDAADR